MRVPNFVRIGYLVSNIRGRQTEEPTDSAEISKDQFCLDFISSFVVFMSVYVYVCMYLCTVHSRLSEVMLGEGAERVI
jgi:hypothetical protein